MASDVDPQAGQRLVDGMREAGEKFVARWREAVVESVDGLVDAELERTGVTRKAEDNGHARR